MNTVRDSLSSFDARVRGGTDAIASASAEIATGNLDFSNRTEAQAAAQAQIAGSMTQPIGAVQQNAEYASQASRLAEDASKVSLAGGAAVEGVVAAMNLIEQSSRKIDDIISVIDGIAFQANILALNARSRRRDRYGAVRGADEIERASVASCVINATMLAERTPGESALVIFALTITRL